MNSSNVCDQCDTNCKTCTTSATFCLSCDQSTTLKYLNITNSTTQICVSSCPNGTFPDTSQIITKCLTCISPCQKCNSSVYC